MDMVGTGKYNCGKVFELSSYFKVKICEWNVREDGSHYIEVEVHFGRVDCEAFLDRCVDQSQCKTIAREPHSRLQIPIAAMT